MSLYLILLSLMSLYDIWEKLWIHVVTIPSKYHIWQDIALSKQSFAIHSGLHISNSLL